MKRKALSTLKKWKESKTRSPLLLRGARQVGKTWLVRKLAESFSQFVEINLESDPEYIPLFKSEFGKTEKLIQSLSLLSGKKIKEGETLLFLDEIQVCPEALLALRYFKEKKPGLHVIAAGSLLEFAFSELSFPVGRVDFMHLFPLNFEEFLMAQKREDLIQAILKSGSTDPLSESVHELLLDEVSLYQLTGGMPEVVSTYIHSKNLGECQEIQQKIIADFREDFHKYTGKTNIDHVRLVFQNLPRQLGHKFVYNQVDAEIKSRELSTALRLLEMAGLAYKVYHTSANGLPLDAQIKAQKFKVFFLDVGLAQRILGLNLAQVYVERKNLLANRGGMAEQFVAQEFLSFTPKNQTPELFYWHREAKSSSAEVDLVTEYQSCVLPIEIKSGSGGTQKSLSIFMEEKKDFVSRALRVSTSPFSTQGKVMNIPFYALMKMEKTRQIN